MRLLDTIRNGKKSQRLASKRGSANGKRRGNSGGARRRHQPELTLEHMENRTLLCGGGGGGGEPVIPGSLDASFGDNGVVFTDYASGTDQAQTMVRLADGRILVAGRSTHGSNADFALARYNVDGSLDSSFGVGGRVTSDFGSEQESINAMAIDADGKIVVAGEIRTPAGFFDFVVARYNHDGSLDTSFGAGGAAITDFAGDFDAAYDLALQSDGKIVVTGTAADGGYRMGVARYNTDGTLDTTFDADGMALVAFPDSEASSSAIALLPDGRILLGGYSMDMNLWEIMSAMARLNPDGSLDTSFGAGGLSATNFVFDGEQIYDLVLTPSGDIVAAGEGFFDFTVMKFDASGAPLTSFGSGGIVVLDISGSFYTDSARRVALDDADGKIYAAGYSGNDFGTDMVLVRLNADGSLDTALDGDGIVLTDLGSTDDVALGMHHDAQTLILAGSSFNSTGEDYNFALVRFLLSGETGGGGGSNQAPTANAGGPYVVNEGDSILLDGSASSDPDGSALSYEWDLDYDGVTFNADAGGAAHLFAGLDGPHARTVALRVSDGCMSHIHVTTVNVLNLAPTVNAGADHAAYEGDTVNVSASVSDPGAADTHSVTWELLLAGNIVMSGNGLDVSFDAPDNGVYTLIFTAVDDDGASASESVDIVVANVAPTAAVGGDASGVRYQGRTLVGSFTDPGALDTHEVRWDFGDGSSTGWLAVTDPNLSISHVWTATGAYTVTMSVRDKDGGISSDTHVITIKVVELQQYPGGGVGLVVGGTSGSDSIEFNKSSGMVAVYVNDQHYGSFNHSGKLIVYGGDGDDNISANGMQNQAALYGGAGNDTLTGGVNSDTLVGGAGVDRLNGSGGHDNIVKDPEDRDGNAVRSMTDAIRDTFDAILKRLRRGSPVRPLARR